MIHSITINQVESREENKMKHLITTIVLLFTATATMANDYDDTPRYIEHESGIFIDREPTIECSNTDVIIGVASGVVVATTIGVATAASLPVVGGGYAAGATLGWSGAFTAPFFTGTTVYTVAAANTILTPILSVAGFYGSCVVQNVYDLW
jgi:hypothetical protein